MFWAKGICTCFITGLLLDCLLCSDISLFVQDPCYLHLFKDKHCGHGVTKSRTWLSDWTELIVVVAQSCPILCNPIDCSLPGSSVHGILQARVLEWVAFPFSRGSSPPRDRTQVSRIAGGFFTRWATREAWTELICIFMKRLEQKILHRIRAVSGVQVLVDWSKEGHYHSSVLHQGGGLSTSWSQRYIIMYIPWGGTRTLLYHRTIVWLSSLFFVPSRSLLPRPVQGQVLWPGLGHKMKMKVARSVVSDSLQPRNSRLSLLQGIFELGSPAVQAGSLQTELSGNTK